MSRRGAIGGLAVSVALLLATAVVVAGVGPDLPGPEIRSWFGLGEASPPKPCHFDPAKVRHPAGRPQPGSWRTEPNSPSPSPELGAATAGRYVYLVGGQTPEGAESAIVRFDPRTGAYTKVGELPEAVDHPAVVAHDDEIIVVGGYVDGAHSTEKIWAFSPRNGELRELPSMKVPRGAAAAAVVGEQLFVAGGLLEFGNQYEPRSSLEIFDFATEEWTPGPDMPTARHHFGAATVDGKLYFAGGRQPGDLSLAAFEEFDPTTERWRRLAPLPIGTGSLGVVAADGRVILTGGGEDGLRSEEGKWILPTAYAYDPGGRRWSRLPDMRRPRHGHASAAYGDRIYVFRGIPCPGYGRMASVESLELG